MSSELGHLQAASPWHAAVESAVTSASWETWLRYTQDAEPANEAEAEAFGRFRLRDEEAWARYEVERRAWARYIDGQEPANDRQAHWFQIFREAGEVPGPYWQERRAFERYSNGEPPRNAAERQRFARFDEELADADYALHRRDGSRSGTGNTTGPVTGSMPHRDRGGLPRSAHASLGTWEQGPRSADGQQRQIEGEAELEAGA